MNKFFILDDDEIILEVVSIHLQNIFPRTFIRHAQTCAGAIRAFEESPYEFNLVIIDYNLVGESTREFFEYLSQKHPHIPIILHTSEFLSEVSFSKELGRLNERNRFIQKPSGLNDFVRVLSEIYEVEESIFDLHHGYNRIPIQYLYKFNRTKCDYYIKRGEDLYIKMFHEGNEYDYVEINELVQAGVEYIYLKNEEYENISFSVVKEKFLEVELSGQSQDSLFELYKGNFNYIRFLFCSKKVNQNDIKLITKVSQDIFQTVSRNNLLKELMEKTIKDDDFIFEHSILVGVVAGYMLKASDWSTEKDINDIMLAAFIHDLMGDLDWSFAEMELKSYSEDAPKSIYRHGMYIVKKLVEDGCDIQSNVLSIVENHHEPLDIESIGNKFSLESVFKLSHEIVCMMYLMKNEGVELEKILTKITQKYNIGVVKLLADELLNKVKT